MFVSTFSTDPSLHIADAVVKSIVLAMIINFWGGGGSKEFILVHFYVINTLLHVVYVLLTSK